MILLLHSSVLIDLLRGRNERWQFVAELVTSGHSLATTAVNIGEVYGGLRAGEETKTDALLATVDCYPLTRSIAQRAGMVSNYRRYGKKLEFADMTVAATAMEYGLTLFMENVKDFPMPELKLLSLP